MLIDDLSNGSMPDLYTAVGGIRCAVDLQQFMFASLYVLNSARDTLSQAGQGALLPTPQ
jgi:hypothetical protein